ncbi:hypothetical protein [uncultured Mediterranean phage]|nr:hypothetical protein [uncultured Mediterranean phage]
MASMGRDQHFYLSDEVIEMIVALQHRWGSTATQANRSEVVREAVKRCHAQEAATTPFTEET